MLTPARFPFYITYITYIHDSHFTLHTLHTLHYMHILHFTEKNALIATFLGKKFRLEVVSLQYFEQIISFCAIIDYSNTQKESFVCVNFWKIYTKIFSLALLVVPVTNSTCALSFLRVQKLMDTNQNVKPFNTRNVFFLNGTFPKDFLGGL